MRTAFVLTSLFLCALFLSTQANAEVYKRTLPDGSVEFTDVSPGKDAKPVDLPPLTTFPAPAKTPAQPKTVPAPTPAPVDLSYESLAISSPADDASVRTNNGNLTVQISSTPGLHKGHRYILLLDGVITAEGQSGSMQLTNIDRGTHNIQVKIVNESNQLVIQSSPVSFHILRTSTL